MNVFPWLRRGVGFCLALGLLLPALAEPPAPVAPASKVSAFPAKGNRVILMVSAAFPEKGLTVAAREKLTADLRKVLEDAVDQAGLTVVDPQKNDAARKSAEEWAVLQEAAPEKIAEAVKPFAVDGVLRMTARISAPIEVPLPTIGENKNFLARWRLAVESIDARGKGIKETWIVPQYPGPGPRSIPGDTGETAEKACQVAVRRIASRFADALKEKLAVPAAGEKKPN
jgi:hypothetical protein